ncbi:MAG TPA: hypothetical protein VHG92_08495 [Afifellaceae bacterium]|nr:hypothetical protein [Afifellaceae bacterium]
MFKYGLKSAAAAAALSMGATGALAQEVPEGFAAYPAGFCDPMTSENAAVCCAALNREAILSDEELALCEPSLSVTVQQRLPLAVPAQPTIAVRLPDGEIVNLPARTVTTTEESFTLGDDPGTAAGVGGAAATGDIGAAGRAGEAAAGGTAAGGTAAGGAAAGGAAAGGTAATGSTGPSTGGATDSADDDAPGQTDTASLGNPGNEPDTAVSGPGSEVGQAGENPSGAGFGDQNTGQSDTTGEGNGGSGGAAGGNGGGASGAR